jgi:hypothetical protein
MCFNSHKAHAMKEVDYNKLASQFITVLNTKDLGNIEKFVVKNFSPNSLARWEGKGKDRYVGYSMNVALFHGELSVISTELDTSTNRIRHISKVYSKNTDMQHQVVLFFNDDQFQAITGWSIEETPQNQGSKGSLTESQFIEEIKIYTDKLAQRGSFSGTVLLAKNNDILFSAAYGFASRRYDVKNNLETKFQIGSMNKMFTSVAILQLIEAGKVSLDDPLTKFIDKSILGKGDFSKIKIRHLLSHTSGIGNISGYDEIQNKVRSLKDIQHLYSSIDATFEPGTEWRYSNTGMVLLGQVIENVTGENYYDYINDLPPIL